MGWGRVVAHCPDSGGGTTLRVHGDLMQAPHRFSSPLDPASVVEIRVGPPPEAYWPRDLERAFARAKQLTLQAWRGVLYRTPELAHQGELARVSHQGEFALYGSDGQLRFRLEVVEDRQRLLRVGLSVAGVSTGQSLPRSGWRRCASVGAVVDDVVGRLAEARQGLSPGQG